MPCCMPRVVYSLSPGSLHAAFERQHAVIEIIGQLPGELTFAYGGQGSISDTIVIEVNGKTFWRRMVAGGVEK